MEVLKTLKMWQVGVLATTLIGAGVATFAGFELIDSSDQGSLDENQQLIPVQLGDLRNEVSTNGSLVFPNRELLTFGTQGTVGTVLVEEGQRIEDDQLVASLDQVTIASLEKAVAQARINLDNAQEALASLLEPRTPLEEAQAESKVANARLTLKKAADDLDLLLNPEAQPVVLAQEAVASARLSLENAQEALTGLLQPTNQEIAQAESAVTSAKLVVADAQDILSELMSGPDQEDVDQAQSQIESATVTLANAQGDLSLTRQDWADRLKTKADDLQAAQDAYSDVYPKWLGIKLSQDEQRLDPDALLASWEIDFRSLFNPSLRFEDLIDRGILATGPPDDDPATPWSETVVYLWLNTYPGEIHVTCDGSQSPRALCISQELSDSWDVSEELDDDLATLETQSAKAISNGEIAVARAEDSLEASQTSLSDLMIEADPLEVEDRQKRLALAQTALESAQSDLSDLQNIEDSLEIEAKRQQIAVAQGSLDQKLEDLELLLEEPDALELEVQRQLVAVAKASLDEAQDDLEELTTGADPLEVSLREADIASAHLSLETAEEHLASVTIRSPMAGLVTMVNVEAGQDVNARTPVIEIADTTVIEVDAIVDEIDVLFVREGAVASVSMDALPGEVLAGTVSSITTGALNQQGVVSYPIRIRLELGGSIQLREGLSATASIVIREDNNVLMVPTQAIFGSFDQPVVRLLSTQGIVEQAVELGNSDDFWTVVTAGLKQGDQVVIQTAEASDDPFATFRQARQAGNFSGGGGNFGGIGGDVRRGGGGQGQPRR